MTLELVRDAPTPAAVLELERDSATAATFDLPETIGAALKGNPRDLSPWRHARRTVKGTAYTSASGRLVVRKPLAQRVDKRGQLVKKGTPGATAYQGWRVVGVFAQGDVREATPAKRAPTRRASAGPQLAALGVLVTAALDLIDAGDVTAARHHLASVVDALK